MDAIRVSKVEKVVCIKFGISSLGTVHLTAHHLIFRYDNGNEEEMWVPYPLISLVTRLPLTLHGKCPLTLHCRTFESFTLLFPHEGEATDVFESVKELTVAISVTQLYAFYYVPNPPLSSTNGWSIYSPRDEFGRMGVGSRTKAWRFTDINKDYSFCSTYPARLVVPTKISDTTLQYAAKYRSKCRIPALSYLHWSNYATITRSSQPMVGITQNRSIQDEKLIESIFQSHHSPESRASGNTPIYGATSTNIIIDARPTTNAVANTAKGAGTENMDHYKEARKAYLGIDNIHVMRDSLNKVVDALREADSMSASVSENLNAQLKGLTFLDRQALRRSGWLRHLSTILEGALLIIRNVHINSSHVLIHCSDGWDRTAQLSSVAQLCLDPFYRTMRGFQILIEKDWLSFGHKFLDRCGHLSSEKFFLSPSDVGNAGDGAQSFLASVQNRFASQQHLKETSPVFHQFLESVRQVQRQFPERFEFNERFLQQIHYHLYACQFGTFLFNCDRDRRIGEAGAPYIERTVSVWDYFNSPQEVEKNLNADYDRSLDDPLSRAPKADMGVLFPNPRDVRFWYELYGRTDEEMNGRAVTSQIESPESLGSIEKSEDEAASFGPPTPSKISLPPSPSPPSPAMPAKTLEPSFVESRRASFGLSASSPTFSSSSDHLPTTGLAPSMTSLRLSASSSTPASPNPLSGKLANSSVKAMWGKLSSNASAAFSVVQDAYVGVARDLGGHSGDRELAEQSSPIGNWKDDYPWDTSHSEPILQYTLRPSSNPWASVRGQTSAPSSTSNYENPYENPWNTSRVSQPQNRSTLPTANTIFEAVSLPPDPTVAHPAQRPPERRRPSEAVRGLESKANVEDNESDKSSRTYSDPLGVGTV